MEVIVEKMRGYNKMTKIIDKEKMLLTTDISVV